MAIIKWSGTSVLWTEFWFEGKRYRQTTGTANRRSAKAFEQKLRQQLHDRIKLGIVAYEPMRFDEAVKRYRTTHLSVKVRLDRTAEGDVYTFNKVVEMVGASRLLTAMPRPLAAPRLSRPNATAAKMIANRLSTGASHDISKGMAQRGMAERPQIRLVRAIESGDADAALCVVGGISLSLGRI